MFNCNMCALNMIVNMFYSLPMLLSKARNVPSAMTPIRIPLSPPARTSSAKNASVWTLNHSCSPYLTTAPSANVLNAAPRQDANEPNQYKADERPCPTCRGAISHKTIFSRSAFEPTDAELAAATGRAVKAEDEDVIMISDSEDEDDFKGKGRARPAPGRSLRVKRRLSYAESEEEEDEDDSMSDFIVEDDDEDWEERRDARREEKRAARRASKGKGRAAARRVVMSDSEDEGVILGAKPTIPQDIPKEQIALLPKFLPSTKMKVSIVVLYD